MKQKNCPLPSRVFWRRTIRIMKSSPLTTGSEDTTGSILDAAARNTSRLKVVHVASLPAGWLGERHGLQQAFEHSNGEWLVFTECDVRFEPEDLRSTIAAGGGRHGIT